MAGPNQRKGDTHRDSQKEKVSDVCWLLGAVDCTHG